MRLTATECLEHSWFQSEELPVMMPTQCESPIDNNNTVIPTNIRTEVLIRTPESPRKIIDGSVKRQSSFRRTPEMTRKTIECVRRTPETAHKLMVHGFLKRTPEVTRKSFPSPEPVRKLTEINPSNKANIEKNVGKSGEKTRKHSFNESLDDLNSIREKTRKLSEGKPFENRRQTSMRDLSRRSSIELLVNGLTKKRQTSFRETGKKNVNDGGSKNFLNNDESSTTVPKNKNCCQNEKVIKKKFESSKVEEAVKENVTSAVKPPSPSEQKHREQKQQQQQQQRYHPNETQKSQTLHKNLTFFLKNEDSHKIYFENTMKKALSAQTLPIHPIFHRSIDKTIYKCKRIFIDDEIGNNATILIPVNSGQSSMSSISGTSSETSSITSDTVSEMSVDSSGDCSSFISSDDSLDYVYKSVWDSGLKAGKVWIKECRGSFERALSRFNLDKPSGGNGGGGGVGGVAGEGGNNTSPTSPHRYQKNCSGGLNRKSIYMSSPILNKIGNLGTVGCTDTRKYGVQLMKEGNGNLVVIREVKAGRYTKFSEVKCESVQSRIKKLQDHQRT